MVIGSLLEFLRLADKEQRLGFAASARLLRGIVIAEVVVVLLTVLLVLRATRRANRVIIIAGVVLLIGLVDVIFTAQAGVIP